jgi:hypothetical protein
LKRRTPKPTSPNFDFNSGSTKFPAPLGAVCGECGEATGPSRASQPSNTLPPWLSQQGSPLAETDTRDSMTVPVLGVVLCNPMPAKP